MGFRRASSTVNVITGIGWIARREYGCVAKKLHRSYPDIGSLRTELKDTSVLRYPMKGFGNYDLVSKMTCCVVALALYDAEMTYSEARKQDIGILGTNTDGCLQANVDFFKDYVEKGRNRGRASLFVNTLPSIPVAQAAIYFKLQGPLLYMTSPPKRVPSLLSQCDRMILRGESPAMLAVSASEEDALCFAVRRGEDVSAAKACRVDEVVDVAEEAASVDEMIAAFAHLRSESTS
jgi:hypothetical protein